MYAIAYSLCFVVIRLLLVAALFTMPGPVPKFFALGELFVVVTTLVAVFSGTVDKSWSGLLVPVVYLLPLSLAPSTGVSLSTFLASLTLAMFFLWQIIVRIMLGRRCTIGVPVAISVERRGPYRAVRHPLAVLESLAVLVVVATNPTLANALIGLLAVSGFVCVVLIEERHLLKHLPDYSLYVAAVRSRMIPGVW